MTLTLGSSTSITAQLALGIIGAIVFSALIIWLLIEIELNNIFKAASSKPKKKEKKTEPKEGEGDDKEEHDDHDEPAGETPRPRKLDRELKMAIMGKVAIIVLIAYLLLVFLPSGLGLSLLGLFAVVGVLLRASIIEEHRRQRYDRLSAIVTFILLIASGMSIATYARLAGREGTVYEGPARIVGYDDTSYNDEGNDVTRTDLEVSWGGEWACPGTGNYCAAFVNGALCEIDEDANGGDRRLDGDGEDVNENGDQDDNNEDAGEDNGGDEENEEDLEEENEELEEEYEELEEENEELQEENEELEEENEDLYEDEYTFDDDYFGDDFWVADWGSIWGDYACNDLFDTDLEGMEYDADAPPGDDGWPYVNIYGSCNSCTAYLVDYYSSEHFKKIKAYRTQARNYMIAGLVSLLVTGAFVVKERVSPSKENEIVLLTNEGGSIA